MAIKYKIDVMKALKEAGYTTIVLREEHHIGESAMTKFRRGEYVSLDIINRVCKLLRCQPGDIMEYVDNGTAANSMPSKSSGGVTRDKEE